MNGLKCFTSDSFGFDRLLTYTKMRNVSYKHEPDTPVEDHDIWNIILAAGIT